MFLSNYTQFIEKVYKILLQLGIDTSKISIDHVGYQADSAEDYDQQISHINESSIQMSESIIGGRRVGIFKLHTPLTYEGKSFSVIEIFEPREGQEVKSAWEHVEFLAAGTLEEFISEYPKIHWDTSVINREEFPMLILKLGDSLRAKFPRMGVLNEIKRQAQ